MSSSVTKASLFHRRLLLIAGAMAAVMLLLGAQLGRLSVVEGAARRAKAEIPLHRSTLLPTYRGTIYDRLGRQVAFDQPGYAIAIEFEVISGRWAERRAKREVRRDFGRRRWNLLSSAAREQAIEQALPTWTARVEELYGRLAILTGLSSSEIDERIEDVRASVQALAEKVWVRQESELKREYGDDAVFTPGDLREHRRAHVIVPNVSDEIAHEARVLALEFDGMMSVVDARRREYPWASAMVTVDRDRFPGPLASVEPLRLQVDGVADHIIGSMRDVLEDDYKQRPFRGQAHEEPDLGGYRREGDVAGASGLERSFEHRLRGDRGEVRRRLDTGATRRREPRPGEDLQLALDIRLQARVQALLHEEAGLTVVQSFHNNDDRVPLGSRLNSAAVVVEIASGDVLAMVSMPTIAAGRALAKRDPDRALVDLAWINRPAEAVYPPGSIIKPLVFVAAHAEGAVRLDEEIRCEGKFFAGSERPRCWIYREKWDFQTHEWLDASEALAQSCNIYFYTLADRLGMPILAEHYRGFGLGALPGLGLRQSYFVRDENDPKLKHERYRGEHPGFVIGVDEIETMDDHPRRFATVSMGIGQGRGVTWTPAQAANAYATLARGGTWRPLRLVRGAESAGEFVDLGLDRGAIDIALRGLRGSLQPGGTGAVITLESGEREPIISAPDVHAWGKTGTAQAPPLRLVDTNGDGAIDGADDGVRGLDHAWFVGMVGEADAGVPQYVIAVIVEYGGSGGRVAGPIANQIILALQEEGYLARGAETAEVAP